MAITSYKVQTTEDTQVFINFEQGKAATEIVTEILDVTEVTFPEASRELKKKGTVAGNEYTAPGKLTNSDIDVKFLLNSDTTTIYNSFRAGIKDVKKGIVSLRLLAPWGETFVGNYAIAKVSVPAATENHEIVEVTISLSPSGEISQTQTPSK
ncbi:hypothetical protein J4G57_05330 [Aeromonas caviae]|uniref:hypothetical protein n=1 Tax=Aeromonas TaxID=642 RepID=UPI000F768EBE|nr:MULTISPECIES: hypothetical protein [Aeromonas]MBS4707315.1 hypothetical protein [Aeromonas caviae]RSM32287.1 hypothetical protein C5B78_00975 [Aeromonas salmonicida]